MTETNSEYEKYFGSKNAAGGSTGQRGGPPQDDPNEPIDFDAEGARTLEEGEYPAVISEPPKRQTSQNGNPMLVVTFMVSDGPFTGQVMWKRFMLSGPMGRYTKQFLRAIELNDMADGLRKIFPMELKDRRCVIHVRPQKNDPDYNEIWKVSAHPEGATTTGPLINLPPPDLTGTDLTPEDVAAATADRI